MHCNKTQDLKTHGDKKKREKKKSNVKKKTLITGGTDNPGPSGDSETT